MARRQVRWQSGVLAALGILCSVGAAALLLPLWPEPAEAPTATAEVAALRRALAQARQVPAASVDPGGERRLIAVTGTLLAAAPLADPGLLAPSDYIEIWRDVQVYAWTEVAVAPGRYHHELRFVSDPPASAELHVRAGHENPPPLLRSEVRSAEVAFVGAYRFQPGRARLFPEPLPLSPGVLAGRHLAAGLRGGAYLYLGPGRPEAPALGDVRISYRVVRAGREVTLLGEGRGDEVHPLYQGQGAPRLYHLLPGPPYLARRLLHRQKAWPRPALFDE
jgi:hypothetical protein